MEIREDDDLEGLNELLALGPVILDGYTLCGSGCSAPNPTTGACPATTTCKGPCSCHLFGRSALDPPQDPNSWKHKANPGVPHAPIAGQVYRCFCVK